MLPKLINNQSETGNPEKLSLIFFRPSKEIARHHNLAYGRLFTQPNPRS